MLFRHIHHSIVVSFIFLNGFFFNMSYGQDKVLSIDSFVPYVSTVPANKNQMVFLKHSYKSHNIEVIWTIDIKKKKLDVGYHERGF